MAGKNRKRKRGFSDNQGRKRKQSGIKNDHSRMVKRLSSPKNFSSGLRTSVYLLTTEEEKLVKDIAVEVSEPVVLGNRSKGSIREVHWKKVAYPSCFCNGEPCDFVIVTNYFNIQIIDQDCPTYSQQTVLPVGNRGGRLALLASVVSSDAKSSFAKKKFNISGSESSFFKEK